MLLSESSAPGARDGIRRADSEVTKRAVREPKKEHGVQICAVWPGAQGYHRENHQYGPPVCWLAINWLIGRVGACESRNTKVMDSAGQPVVRLAQLDKQPSRFRVADDPLGAAALTVPLMPYGASISAAWARGGQLRSRLTRPRRELGYCDAEAVPVVPRWLFVYFCGVSSSLRSRWPYFFMKRRHFGEPFSRSAKERRRLSTALKPPFDRFLWCFSSILRSVKPRSA